MSKATARCSTSSAPCRRNRSSMTSSDPARSLGGQHPVAEHCRELLDRGDHRQPEAQPLPGWNRRPQGRCLTEQLLEEEIDVPREVRGVEPLRREMVQHIRVLHAGRRLLPHEALDLLEEFGVPDQRQPLLEDLHEPPLPRRQRQMQHIDDVGGGGLAGDPVQRGLLPAEGDPARGARAVPALVPLVLGAHSGGSSRASARNALGAKRDRKRPPWASGVTGTTAWLRTTARRTASATFSGG